MQHSSRKLFRTLLTALIVLGGSIYIYSQLGTFLTGPRISITSPSEVSSVTQAETITLSGTAQNVANLNLNGNNITVNQRNEFREQLPLLPGFNILEIHARDRFGRTETQTRYIVYEPQREATGTTTPTP